MNNVLRKNPSLSDTSSSKSNITEIVPITRAITNARLKNNQSIILASPRMEYRLYYGQGSYVQRQEPS